MLDMTHMSIEINSIHDIGLSGVLAAQVYYISH